MSTSLEPKQPRLDYVILWFFFSYLDLLLVPLISGFFLKSLLCRFFQIFLNENTMGRGCPNSYFSCALQ